jgi:phosphoglycolate phosphatase-like HAD superfamily hydrolase
MDGVMVEPEPEAHIAAHIDSVRDIWGIDIPREKFWNIIDNGLTDRAIAQALLQWSGRDTKDIPLHEVNRWRVRCGELFQMYTALSEYRPQRLGHVRSGLDRARSISNIQLALATGNLEAIAKAKLALTELDEYFDGSGGYGDFTLNRVELVKDALYTAGWDPQNEIEKASMQSRIYLLGDTVHDMSSARELGIHAIGVATGGHGIRELRDAGAEAVFLRFDRAVEWVIDRSERVWTATI